MSEAGPIIITAAMGDADQGWANGLRKKYFPPERNFLDAHITLFHHLPPGHLREIKSRLSVMAAHYPPPTSWLSDVMLLGRGVAYRVESDELMAMREELADGFRGLLIPQDQGRPRFHITVQNKVEPAEAKRLHQQLLHEFEPRQIYIKGLSAFHYRGGPWEAIGSWSFRG
ncbi:2'-5' RNA ligase family protein [Sphingorhabdus arenilitoris]|uniref:2'-5' RNA ligase family protein n=1 Tax=Sphingorhabdus arenilitoris TaxID=1490041 RepID=A0ABV8RJA6_9SPHN